MNPEDFASSITCRLSDSICRVTAAGLILFFYSMSGLWKVLSATAALLTGTFGGFSPSAMAVTVANRALLTHSDPLWAQVVIDWPVLGWPLYLGLYYVELVAIAIAFRPALIRLWGAPG